MTYNPGQVEFIYKFINFEPKWFVIGGPADGDEAQCFKKKYPSVSCIGFEPNKRMLSHQAENNFPGWLFGLALWNVSNHKLEFKVPQQESGPDHRSGSVCREFGDHEIGESYCVETVTLDFICYPFSDMVLWIDVEGSELQVLQGAERLLRDGCIRLINLEVMLTEVETTGKAIHDLLTGYGFVKMDHWDRQSGNHYDVIYRLDNFPKTV